MELIERSGFLATLHSEFEKIAGGEGHCILVSGEAGIGKTSLVRAFCKEREKDSRLFQGTCDALFTPRPLAPLHDIAWQIRSDFWEEGHDLADRAGLFARFFHEFASQKGTTLIVMEDIHWADEATLDFIKFLARRITRIRCLFILTFRSDEIHARHPLRNVLGQLPPDSFTRLQLAPLSRQAVEKMAVEKGYSGEDVFSISGGNPFYVNEILASYSPGVPDNIKDTILAVFNQSAENTRQLWEILSVLPTGFEDKYLEKIDPEYSAAIQNCLGVGILIRKDGLISFKHELYRRTIESSLSPFVRVELNKRILDLFLESFEENQETERIIHHAKNANEYEIVVHYAPLAAKQAAFLGAHLEACKLYLTAIEYYQGKDKDKLVGFYEGYAYECYLTNKIKDAIIYQAKALNIRKEKGDKEKTGSCMRLLSRLWWFDGNRKQAESYAIQAIQVLEDQPPSTAKAMAFSNMSQLMMLSSQTVECISWGGKAIAMARELRDEETLSHALNNVGTVQMNNIPSSRQEGRELLQKSLELALKNGHHEHAARAYTNLGTCSVEAKEYLFARQIIEAGIRFSENRELDSWSSYMLSFQSRLNLETGNWDEASRIAGNLLKNEDQGTLAKIVALVILGTIKMRKGQTDALPLLLEAKEIAFDIRELQRIIPVMTALLEYEWITGKTCFEKEDLDQALKMVDQLDSRREYNEFSLWLSKTGKSQDSLSKGKSAYIGAGSAEQWAQWGCPYEQALALFEGNESEKKQAISLVHNLGAHAVYEKWKQDMKASGIKNIPRGIRKSTQANPALLTDRELDVLRLLQEGRQNKEIAAGLYISPKTVDHHISSILFKLDVPSRMKAVQEATRLGILK
ncbi:helix-turn-helix transcriptional regulator [Flavitalea flava]